MRKAILFLLLTITFQSLTQETELVQKINGISIRSDLERRTKTDFDFVKGSNANWVSLQPHGVLVDDSSGVNYDIDTLWECSSFEGLANNISICKDLGYWVFVKPHLILGYKKSGAWVGDLRLGETENWDKFKQTYASFVIELALLSDSLKVDMLSLGTEIKQIPSEDTVYWSSLIDTVQKVYQGKLTYCANFDAYEEYPFWDRMDYIGIDSYFSINNSKNANLDDCRKAWQPIALDLQELSEKFGKQILYTEYGYMSVDHCAHRPFEQQSGNVNLVAQANAYRALFDTFWRQGWFAGGFSWRWYFDNEIESYDNPYYSPQNKPAGNILSEYYKRYRYY